MFPIAPDVLHRVEFRRVGGQVLKIDPASLAGDKLSHQPAAMGLRTIPDHQQLARQVAQQMTQEVDLLRPREWFFGKAENRSSTK
jgi:hypothetical protein